VARISIGTAGWSIPRQEAEHFPSDGSALQRYAARFPVAEINSSFHRSHRLTTWERWRESVPANFRFSVKVPKTITHERKLVDCTAEVKTFLGEAGCLREKLAVLLVQLPPKLSFDKRIAAEFFADIRARSPAEIACEPRHASWFAAEVDSLLDELHVARVAADPAICAEAARPGGRRHLSYWRLHGSPVIYRSSYRDRIAQYAEALRAEGDAGRDVWCIFDNTASSAGAGDALALIGATDPMAATA
jgi:uncharacterized protein YecE (DUF72 family)